MGTSASKAAAMRSIVEHHIPTADRRATLSVRGPAVEDASRPIVLCLHGRTWSSGPVWECPPPACQALDHFDTLGITAYTLDFRGFGRSTADSAPEPTAVGFPQLRPSQCAADIVTVLEWLAARRADAVGAGGEAAPAAPIALLGWSYGALVAQMVAADPVVAERGLLDGGLVLYATVWDAAGGFADDAGRFACAAPRGPQTVADTVSDFGVPGSIDAPSALAFGRAAVAADPVMADWGSLSEFGAGKPEAIVTPTLVIYGECDEYAPAAEQRELFGRLAAKEKYLVVVPASDHCVHLLAQRELWFAGVTGFLRRPCPAGGGDPNGPRPMDAAIALDAKEAAAAAAAATAPSAST